jgi:hypothetical protein
MPIEIKRYQIQNPILRPLIKFFWEVKPPSIAINYRIISQRNKNLKLNLSITPAYACTSSSCSTLEEIFFSELQDSIIDTQLSMHGQIHMLGIRFKHYGFYPFMRTPISEFNNQLLDVNDIGFTYQLRTP